MAGHVPKQTADWGLPRAGGWVCLGEFPKAGQGRKVLQDGSGFRAAGAMGPTDTTLYISYSPGYACDFGLIVQVQSGG